MNKSWFYLGVIGSFAILITSCGEGKPPTPVASPAPTKAVPPIAPAQTVVAATPAATKPTVPAKPTAPAKPKVAIKPVSVDVTAGLIPPTDGESWAKTVSKGRPDPFAMLAIQPVEIIEPIDPLIQAVAPQQPSSKLVSNIKSGVQPSPLATIKVAKNLAKIARVSGKQKIPSKGKDSPVAIANTPKSVVLNRTAPKIATALRAPSSTTAKTISKLGSKTALRTVKPLQTARAKAISVTEVPGKTQIAAKPEKVAEKPLQAMAIEISGVIEVSGKTQVIIKLPTESFSRYIEVGERISNGKVLVKRVEGQNSLSPTVVLEEVGVEVPRKIGDKSSAPEVPTEPPVEKTL